MNYLTLILLILTAFTCDQQKEVRSRSVIMPDGKSIKLFKLTNSQGLSVEVMEYGATILSISTPDRNGKFDDIVAGYDSAASYFTDKSYFGCVVGRYANRIAEGKFILAGKEYNLSKNEKNITHLHGGINGLNKKIWEGTKFTGDEIQSVKFNYSSPDGEEGYPGKLDVTVTYALNDSNELHIDYQAKTDKPTVVNLSNHSYFNLSGDCKNSILNHRLQINADSYLPVDPTLIPTGKAQPVRNTPFDFREAKAVGQDIAVPDDQLKIAYGGYDHNFILNKKGEGFALRLEDPQSGRVLECYTDQPGMQFYSGNFLDGTLTGKKRCKYQKYGALVFEPQKYPDSPNHPDFPSTVLKPGEVYHAHTILKFKNNAPSSTLTYTNPIINYGLADPNIKFENGFYYLFATGKAPDGRFVPIYRSKDLISWDFVRGAVNQGGKTDWNYKHFWAPEVYKIKNQFYLYYTASPEESPANSGNRVGLAIADQIEGPYRNVGPVVPHASIDGHIYFDKDSSMTIFYTIEHGNKDGLKAGQIYADKMKTPLEVSRKPAQIISHHPWQEGPFVLFRNGLYYLTYSCGNWTDSTYHIRYATARTITGPYTEKPDTILKTNRKVKGPGHHSFFTDKSGKDWIVYHGWDPAHTTRYSRIDRIFFKEDKILSDGPTFTPQSIEK